MYFMRNKVIAGNWKMNKTKEEATEFIEQVNEQLSYVKECVIPIVCAPFIHLATLTELTKNIHIGAQTMHYETKGAYTGEISPTMLKNIGVSYVIIGHSERRQYFNETDKTVNQKVKAAFRYQLTPIICVGESLEQREKGETKDFVAGQVKRALQGLSNEQMSQTIIAYEPIWAIGTGKTASSKDANDVCAHIRQTIAQIANESIANEVVIQYGGSVNPDNIEEILSKEHIDGALVGGASLSTDSFIKLVEAAENA